MLPTHAQFQSIEGETPKSTISVEAGIQEMLTRFSTGRLRVFSNQEQWFQEYRIYHRKEGIIVKEFDDLISSTRYALMMIRYAATDSKLQAIDHDRRSDGFI